MRSAKVVARERLLSRIESLCRRGFNASRFSGAELRLWSIVVGTQPSLFGMTSVSRGERLELRDLSEASGGWWSFEDDVASFIEIDEWVEVFQGFIALDTWAQRGAKR